jgi:hemerythrin superfamily protein
MKATDVIRRDHRAAEELFERYKKANEDDREAMEKKILDALAAHEKMEDDHFYPAVRELFEDSPMLKKLETEQTKLKVGVAGLKLLPFIKRTNMLKTTLENVLAHAQKEETYLLARAEEMLTEEKLTELGETMEPHSAVALEREEANI